jgi:TRAP-type C4-dicarboxylate transport system permease small subunit
MRSNATQEGSAPADPILGETWPERASQVLCQVALIALVLLTTAEVVARLFHTSLEITDEIGGYLLAAITFLSLPVALVGGALHKVEFVQARLKPRARIVCEIVFTLLSLGFAGILLWQLGRLVSRSYVAEVMAPTILGTPLWLPQSAMLVGTAVFTYSLLRLLKRDILRLRNEGRA